MDPQANLTLALGIQPAQTRRSVADLLLGNSSTLGVSRETGIPGLDIIPASGEMLLVERFLYVRQHYEHLLRKALAKSNMYSIILLDCPPSLGALTINALTAAQLSDHSHPVRILFRALPAGDAGSHPQHPPAHQSLPCGTAC